MILVEAHRLPITPSVRTICTRAALLGNHVLHHLKVLWATEKRTESAGPIVARLALTNHPLYRLFPAQTAQGIVVLAVTDYSNFVAALVAYRKNPKGFKRKPRCPKYKAHGQLSAFSITNQQFNLVGNTLVFAPCLGLCPLPVDPVRFAGKQLLSIKVTPKRGHMVFGVAYDTVPQTKKQRAWREKLWERKLEKAQTMETAGKRFIADLNLNAIAVLDDTKRDCLPFILISCKTMKSHIRLANKVIGQLRSAGTRACKHALRDELNHRDKFLRWQNNELHQMTNAILALVTKTKAKYFVVGQNKGWKTGCKLGRTTQLFVGFPFAKLIGMLRYKCRRLDIVLITTEENHTSKVDHLAKEGLEHQKKYTGTRISRGQFKSSTGITIHADLNGCMGIGRKVDRQTPTGSNVAGEKWLSRKVIPLLLGRGTRVVPRKCIAGTAGFRLRVLKEPTAVRRRPIPSVQSIRVA